MKLRLFHSLPVFLQSLIRNVIPARRERLKELEKELAMLRLLIDRHEVILETLRLGSSAKVVDISGSRHEEIDFVRRAVVTNGRIRLPREFVDWPEDTTLETAEVPKRLRLRKRITRTNRKDQDDLIKKLVRNPHPNVLRIFDFDEQSFNAEYIDGLILSNRRKLTPKHWASCYLDQRDARVLFSDIEDAVHHLHSLNIAHTDITSYNILVRRDGRMVLIDLSSCVALSDHTQGVDNDRLSNLRWELAEDFPDKVKFDR